MKALNQPRSPPLSFTLGSSLPPRELAMAAKSSPLEMRSFRARALFQADSVSVGVASGLTRMSRWEARTSSRVRS